MTQNSFPILSQKSVDVLIIGSGMAGLAAAEDCARHGVSYLILEAASQPGGRTRTSESAAGTKVELGANWVHSRDKGEVIRFLESSGLPYDTTDEGTNVSCIYKGREHDADFIEKLEKDRINKVRAAAAYLGFDQPVPKIIKGEDGELLGNFLSRHWVGIEAKDYSATEFTHEPYQTCGYQIASGYGALVEDMVHHIGPERILYNKPVVTMADGRRGVTVTTLDGSEFKAKKAIFTGSVGVLQSGQVRFESAKDPQDERLNWQVQKAVEPIVMGHLAKVSFDLDPDWLAAHPEHINRSLMLFDEPQMFAHVGSGGKPILTVFVGGDAGMAAEQAEPEALRAHAVFSIRKFKGFEEIERILRPGLPVVSQWNTDPYVMGAYSSMRIGGERTGPVAIGRNIMLAGEAFDPELASYVDGALRSGARAAERLIADMRRQAWIDARGGVSGR